jgi:hypothetical protein
MIDPPAMEETIKKGDADYISLGIYKHIVKTGSAPGCGGSGHGK